MSVSLRAESGASGGSLDCHADSALNLLVLLDVTPDAGMQREGLAREVVNRVQKLRKRAGLQPTDPIRILYRATDGSGGLADIVREYADFIYETVKQPMEPASDSAPAQHQLIVHERCSIKEAGLELWIYAAKKSSADGDQQQHEKQPQQPQLRLRYGQEERALRLRDSTSGAPISMNRLLKEAEVLFNLIESGRDVRLFRDAELQKLLNAHNCESTDELDQQVVYIGVCAIE